MTLLAVDKLSVAYGDLFAVREVSFSVDEGTVNVQHQLFGGNPVELHPGDSIRVFRDQRLAARTIDKGNLARGALRAAAQAVYDVLYGRANIGGGSTPHKGAARRDRRMTRPNCPGQISN